MGEGRQSWLTTFKSIGDCATWSQVLWQWGGLLIGVCCPNFSASPWESACLPVCVPQSLLSLPSLLLGFKRRKKLNWKVHSGFAIISLFLLTYFPCIFGFPFPPLLSPPLPSPVPVPCDMLCQSHRPSACTVTAIDFQQREGDTAHIPMDVNTSERVTVCILFVPVPFDKLSSTGPAQGFDLSNLPTLWKTLNSLPDPLLCLCLWTFHSPLMRISPNYFSGCSRGTAVYLDLDPGTWLLCW